jgi:hypothetical protein
MPFGCNAGRIAADIGNHQAMHEPERPKSLNELIATARTQFGALRAVGVLTEGQAKSIFQLLECDGGTLSPHDRALRDNILRYLKKEAEFVTVFAEMLQIDGVSTQAAFAAESRRGIAEPLASNRSASSNQSKGPLGLDGGVKARTARPAILSLPPMKAFLIVALVAAAAIVPAVSVFFAPSHESVSPPPGTGRIAEDSDAGSVPMATAAAIFPSSISPAHAGEESYEASLNTCYDQYNANREINANGGLSWNQNGGGYYGECLKRLKP